jgi:hypothetical protein
MAVTKIVQSQTLDRPVLAPLIFTDTSVVRLEHQEQRGNILVTAS